MKALQRPSEDIKGSGSGPRHGSGRGPGNAPDSGPDLSPGRGPGPQCWAGLGCLVLVHTAGLG